MKAYTFPVHLFLQLPKGAIRLVVELNGGEDEATIAKTKDLDVAFCLLKPRADLSHLHASRRVFEIFKKENINLAVMHHFTIDTDDSNEMALQVGTKIGSLLTDGNGDGVMIEQVGEKKHFSVDLLRRTSFSLLQGSRMRNIKTEFVSCPSCGRTLFDLQETTANISKATGHLPGVTIAVMGCIVNGPGEMADADFGYVGSGVGKITLYKGKDIMKRNIDSEIAVSELINLLKEHGAWVEPNSSL